MPELPEVETVRQGLLQGMQGKTFEDVLIRREGLRIPFLRVWPPSPVQRCRTSGVVRSTSSSTLTTVVSCSRTLG